MKYSGLRVHDFKVSRKRVTALMVSACCIPDVQDRAVPVFCCRAAGSAPPSDEPDKEDGLHLCTAGRSLSLSPSLSLFL